ANTRSFTHPQRRKSSGAMPNVYFWAIPDVFTMSGLEDFDHVFGIRGEEEFDRVYQRTQLEEQENRRNIARRRRRIRYYLRDASIESLDARELNNTRKAEIDVIFFNRVPKVGSQTFMELLRRLSMRNNFGFHRDHIQRVETIRLAPSDQMNLATHVTSYAPPAVYVKHVCFTNFTQFGLPEPIYVNLVRDPVERVISWYYYVRAPWYYVERKQAFPDIPLPDPHWLKKDFETCVLRGDRECRYLEGETHEGIGDHRRQSLFFCGHSDACTPFNTIGALQRAKKAVERHYAVVGVLEDFNTTLTVLENYVPLFFEGASEVYWDEVDRFTRINRNLFKPPVSEEVKDIVRQNFTREVEFYQFCRQRLHRQYLALRLPKKYDENDN
ncbi:hypothetical protein L9F63_022348, partial [Diploptera punctata]